MSNHGRSKDYSYVPKLEAMWKTCYVEGLKKDRYSHGKSYLVRRCIKHILDINAMHLKED